MKRVLETGCMDGAEAINAYDSLKTIGLVNSYFLSRALELCPNGRILDVGCGTGRMLRGVKDDYEKHGLDIDERMIELARQRDSDSSYKIGDSGSLPFDSNSFDLVMCHSLLHHLENPKQTIDEIMRVAKRDGAVFIRDLTRPSSEEVLQNLFLEYLAVHYDEQNRQLFENSLRSSFTHSEWSKFFPEHLDVSQVFFYNTAEKAARGAKLDEQGRKEQELEFILRRAAEPLAYRN